jgi:hypothetical protein
VGPPKSSASSVRPLLSVTMDVVPAILKELLPARRMKFAMTGASILEVRVELLFNLVWLTVSLLLVSWWVHTFRIGHSRGEWSVFVALGLLLLMLFPVISMTDDLVAMTSPSEMEHMLRRTESSLMQPATMDPFDMVALAALLFMSIAWLSNMMVRLRPTSFTVTFLSGFARTAGIRPPPVVA